MGTIYTSADQLIGNTPLLELTHIENSEGLSAKLLAKLEYGNRPGFCGSGQGIPDHDRDAGDHERGAQTIDEGLRR